MTVDVTLTVRFKGRRKRDVRGIAQHLLTTFNDDGSIAWVEAATACPDPKAHVPPERFTTSLPVG